MFCGLKTRFCPRAPHIWHCNKHMIRVYNNFIQFYFTTLKCMLKFSNWMLIKHSRYTYKFSPFLTLVQSVKQDFLNSPSMHLKTLFMTEVKQAFTGSAAAYIAISELGRGTIIILLYDGADFTSLKFYVIAATRMQAWVIFPHEVLSFSPFP